MSALLKVCDIFQEEMELADDQVYLWDQKVNVPADNRLYISVGVLSCKAFSNSRYQADDGAGGLNEVLSTNFQAALSVDIMSRGMDALDRKEEIILALRSAFAQESMAENGFYVAGISSNFVNLSALEGAAIPYRFNITVNIQYQVTKVKAIDFYDSFSSQAIDDVSAIGPSGSVDNGGGGDDGGGGGDDGGGGGGTPDTFRIITEGGEPIVTQAGEPFSILEN